MQAHLLVYAFSVSVSVCLLSLSLILYLCIWMFIGPYLSPSLCLSADFSSSSMVSTKMCLLSAHTGIVAGSHHSPSHGSGGSANHLCMTEHPIYDSHVLPSGNYHTGIYGSEYEICPEHACNTSPACAVCRVLRAATVMIPGTNTCTPGWTLEYSGYIMGGWTDHAPSEFICIDSSLGYVPYSQNDDNQNTIFYVATQCGALPCPPYQREKAVTCVVCSK